MDSSATTHLASRSGWPDVDIGMNSSSLLEKAIAIATEAHSGKKDRYSAPYILHPLRVMARVKSNVEKTVAILHDVVEDTDWTLEDLKKEGFPAEILEALDSVTKRGGEDYDHFVERSAANRVGRAVKIADLEDNMDLRRLHEMSEKDCSRMQRYLKAWHRLTGT